ncbi:MAG: hypothetical protein C5B50_27080 [Verrucomicrobia bacterium]|nr:MAG: hypothetical protein C5B50_27080 [Verrucomicrobiota bacterium]
MALRKSDASHDITRRQFCESTTVLGAALLHAGTLLAAAESASKSKEPAGSWPVPRQNRCLTNIQPLAGRISAAPHIVAEIAFPRTQGALTSLVAQIHSSHSSHSSHPVQSKPSGTVDRAVVAANGRLRCYALDGKLLWEAHPPGLNFESVVAAEDLDGDGRVELALMAGRPTQPLGAMVLVDASNGKVLYQYDVEPMSYWWTMKVDHFLPERRGKQILVCEHGYPPDAKFGYIALLAFEKPGETPSVRWRYDFDHYTCFPTLLTADVDGDGVDEICVETHSRMWVLDARTGKAKQFLTWDVSPANIRSYGLVRFQDLNGDGLPEFLCIANFAQHHEVLLNEKGRLKLAWAHGWDTSVTTQTIVTTWPDPPVADVDGDGKLELVVNLFACDKEPRWMVRIYDALTGVLKATALDRVATYLHDVDGDGAAELLADISHDPTLTYIQGACLLKSQSRAGVSPAPQTCNELWNQEGVHSAPLLQLKRTDAAEKLPTSIFVQDKSGTRQLSWEAGQGVVLKEGSPPKPPAGPDFSRIPSTVGPALNTPLVADVDGDGRNEVVHWHEGRVTIYRYERGKGFRTIATHSSAAAPALADLDGDGQLEMVIGVAGPTIDPVIHALRPGREPESLWKVTLKPRDHEGVPHGPPLVFQTGHFLGRVHFPENAPSDHQDSIARTRPAIPPLPRRGGEGRGEGERSSSVRFTEKRAYDLYVYVGTPNMRSLVLDGINGRVAWEKGKIPGLERYYGPTVNLSAVWDVNGDGKDDLVFTCPDYYCVSSGATGEPLVGPAYPPNIFNQPSQGLYTAPAILPNKQGDPTVCLFDGHYFLAAMSAHAAPLWYHLPPVGEAKAGAEGFIQTREGQWLIGFGRQDGQFVCLDLQTGKSRWQLPLRSTASAVAACDINGDGQQEFIFGTTHGDLYAVADAGDHGHVVWRARLPAAVGAPVIADVDNDGSSEILVTLGDGRLCLLRPAV